MGQPELFPSMQPPPARVPDIPGLVLRNDFLTLDEEQELIAHIDSLPWQSDYRRRIQQYGLGYSSSSDQPLVWLRDFPGWLTPLAERVSKDSFDHLAENCVINEYLPPLGIAPHRDYVAFGPVVACVSLGSDINLDFISPDKNIRIPVHVPARSFWKISGEARSEWLHGIAPRLKDVIQGEPRSRSRRISITFRTATRPVS